jgi:protein-S-isoprenylcysteine O-methyltransferase Ste14
MRAFRIGTAAFLVFGLAASAIAGDLNASAAQAAAQQEERGRPARSSHANAETWAGTALFVGGMAVGLYAFLNDKNGTYAEFGESTAVNKSLGAAGLGAAFVGGALIYLGQRHAKRGASVTIGARRLTVSKQVAW